MAGIREPFARLTDSSVVRVVAGTSHLARPLLSVLDWPRPYRATHPLAVLDHLVRGWAGYEALGSRPIGARATLKPGHP